MQLPVPALCPHCHMNSQRGGLVGQSRTPMHRHQPSMVQNLSSSTEDALAQPRSVSTRQYTSQSYARTRHWSARVVKAGTCALAQTHHKKCFLTALCPCRSRHLRPNGPSPVRQCRPHSQKWCGRDGMDGKQNAWAPQHSRSRLVARGLLAQWNPAQENKRLAVGKRPEPTHRK